MLRTSVPLLVVLGLATGCVDARLGGDDPPWTSWGDAAATERVPVRVASWNVQELGSSESRGFEALSTVLKRLDADVVLLNEIESSESAELEVLASGLGYDAAWLDVQPFGTLGNAVLYRLDVVDRAETDGFGTGEAYDDFFLSGAELAGEDALDLTREHVAAVFEVPGTAATLGVVGVHFKSGFDDDDEFRRTVDAQRAAQAAQVVSELADVVLVMGDINEEEDEAETSNEPSTWTQLPGGLPSSYDLGSDLAGRLGDGIPHDAYGPLEDAGFAPIDLAQRDGELGTRPSSGRRIDRLFADVASRGSGLRGEVYETRLDTPDMPGLADGDAEPEPTDVTRASDHLPLLVELRIAAE